MVIMPKDKEELFLISIRIPEGEVLSHKKTAEGMGVIHNQISLPNGFEIEYISSS